MGLRDRVLRILKMGLSPLIFYFVIFCLLTYPLILQFSTHFFADQGDGLQNVWNLWWVNKAVTQLHQSPWQTSYLHYPHGISLVGHTLNPFNGLMGIGLLKFFTIVETYNFIVVFSFIAGGLTTFWLAYYLTKSYWGSLTAGFIFTFSNYHFAHAEGHLNLVSLEWLPLFVLGWYVLITRPGIMVAIASALVLFLVFLCDYYYFFYGLLAGGLMVIWYAIQKKNLFFFRKNYLIPFIVFTLIILVTTGPLVSSLLLLNIKDPWWGSHPSAINSLDLLAPFIPGGHWRLANLTQFYWSKLPGNIHESSVHLGVAVIFMLIYTWFKRRELRVQRPGLWYFVLIFFGVMSLGPVLHIWGKEITYLRLPYAWCKLAFPSLKLSNCLVRTMVMVMLMGILLFVLNYIRAGRRRGLWFWYIALIFVVIIIFEAALHIWGSGIFFLKMPYTLLEKTFPPLKLSGNPGRMMVIVGLSASVIWAMGFKMLFQNSPKKRLLIAFLLIMIFFEYLPRPIPSTRLSIPGYVEILKDLPDKGGIIDTVNPPLLAGYYQTIHQKPLAFSDVSRIPRSVQEKDSRLRQLIQNKEYGRLYFDYHIRYMITDAVTEITDDRLSIELLYQDAKVKLYALRTERK